MIPSGKTVTPQLHHVRGEHHKVTKSIVHDTYRADNYDYPRYMPSPPLNHVGLTWLTNRDAKLIVLISQTSQSANPGQVWQQITP